MGKRKPKRQDGDKGDRVRWEMSMTAPGPHGQTIERHGEGIVIINYVPLEEWPPAQRAAWDQLWQLLLTPRPDSEATDRDRPNGEREVRHEGE